MRSPATFRVGPDKQEAAWRTSGVRDSTCRKRRVTDDAVDAGFTPVALVPFGGDSQAAFIDWARQQLLPRLNHD